MKVTTLVILAVLAFFYFYRGAGHLEPKRDIAQEETIFEETAENNGPKIPAEPRLLQDFGGQAPAPSLSQAVFEILTPMMAPLAESEQTPENSLTAYVVDLLEEKTVNKKSIVAVQCVWDYTYPENVSEDPRFHSKTYYQGSGIVITEEGHILTVNHVLDPDLGKEPDEAGRSWFLKECQAGPTDDTSSPLPYNSPRFKEAEIIFQPSSEYYDYGSDERVDFDFALLRFKEADKYGFTPLFPGLMDSEGTKTSMFLMGYPGAELTGKREFKTLEFFSRLEKYRGRNKGNSAFFYQAGSGQFSASSESYKKFQEDLFASGQDTRLVRGGFSGSPVFIKGHLAGITISSSLPYVEAEDMILVISSYSIFELLEKSGIVL